MHEASIHTRSLLMAVIATVSLLVTIPARAETGSSAAAKTTALPVATSGLQTAVFAGGCFWGVDAAPSA